MRRSAGRRRIAAGIAVSLLAVACSAGSDTASDDEADDLPDISVEDEESEPEPEPDPEPDPEPEPEPDPEPEDEPTDGDDTADDYDGFPIDQPVEDISVIDEAYVNEVLRVLDENYVEVVRAVQLIGVDNIDNVAYAEHILLPLAFTYSEELEEVAYQRTIAFQERGGLLDDPEPLRSSVTELLSVTEECVSAELTRESKRLYREPFQGLWYVSITPRGRRGGDAGTIWRFRTESPSGGEVIDACA